MSPEKNLREMPSERILLALSVLLSAHLDALAERDGGRRSEIVLNEAGFSHAEVAQLVGRKPEAVRSTLRRAAKKPTRT